jgi:putative ABC transport system substrate-binding protein
MRRRKFIALLGSAATLPIAARAQQSERVRLIGVLMAFAESDPAGQSEVVVFRDALKKLGWTDGNNLRIEVRWGAGELDRIKTFAKE